MMCCASRSAMEDEFSFLYTLNYTRWKPGKVIAMLLHSKPRSRW